MKLKSILSTICCLALNIAIGSAHTQGDLFSADDVAAAVSKAQPYLTGKLHTVTTKDVTPPSGDKRDYVSMSNYYWPDPESPNGYPYIYRDGEYNPESTKLYTDWTTFTNMTGSIVALGEAYRYTKDDIYVNRIEDIINYFFINEETRMNPHLDFAKIIPQAPGVISEGNCFGVLETSSIQFMLKTVASISQSDAWSDAINDGLVEWIEQFQVWLSTSKLGTTERTRGNNHGTHYDSQYLSLLIFLDKRDEAAEYIKEWTLPRIDKQIAKDGSQPNELQRTKSWNYCLMNLKGWMRLADYADQVGIDLWGEKRGKQVYIQSMVEWYIPYLTEKKEWGWQQIIRGHLMDIVEVLDRASEVYDDSKYAELAKELKPLKDGVIR